MRRLIGLGVAAVSLLLLVPAPGSGAARKVPQQIVVARYVCLGYDLGDGFLSDVQSITYPQDVFPEDREALNAVRDQLEKWRRYVITVRPDQAELLIAVRSGRLAGATSGIGIGIGIGSGGGRGTTSRRSAGVEFSTPDDLFTVYESRGGRPGAQLWRVQGRGILVGDPPKAFQEFRDGVERTPAPTPKPTPKPKED